MPSRPSPPEQFKIDQEHAQGSPSRVELYLMLSAIRRMGLANANAILAATKGDMANAERYGRQAQDISIELKDALEGLIFKSKTIDE